MDRVTFWKILHVTGLDFQSDCGSDMHTELDHHGRTLSVICSWIVPYIRLIATRACQELLSPAIRYPD